MKKISADQLIAMDAYQDKHPIRIDLAYAKGDNLLFGERIYREGAQLWLYEDLARIVLEAAKRCFERHGHIFVLYDGLRTVDAQARMLETQRVKDNPHWLEEPRLLSPPGAGGHPRGMAIDIGLMDAKGALLDMGTAFDYLAEDPGPLRNQAHRQHPKLSKDVIKNRGILNDAMIGAAEDLKTKILPLPQEWWDYRLPPEVYEQYAPLSDADLPANMRMMD